MLLTSWLLLSALAHAGVQPTASSTRDTVASDPTHMTFAQAVEAGMAFARDGAIASSEVTRAAALTRQVQATALPTLSASGSYLRLDHERELAGRMLAGENQLNGNVLVRIPLVAPRAWGDVAQAKRFQGVARDRLRDARRASAIATAYAYVAALTAAHQHEVAVRAVDSSGAHLNYAAKRARAGLGNELDVMRADQAHADSEGVLARSRVQQDASEEALGLLTGSTGPVVPCPIIDLPSAPQQAGALAQISWRRKDVRLAQSELELAEQVRRNTWLDFMPTLWASGAVLSQDPPAPTAPKLGWQVQLMLTLPLYDGGLRDGQRVERAALNDQALLRVEHLLRMARSELRHACTAVREHEIAVEAAQRGAASAQKALSLASEAFKAGATGNLEVIDAQRASLDASTRSVDATDALRRAQIQLASAAGLFPDDFEP